MYFIVKELSELTKSHSLRNEGFENIQAMMKNKNIQTGNLIRFF